MPQLNHVRIGSECLRGKSEYTLCSRKDLTEEERAMQWNLACKHANKSDERVTPVVSRDCQTDIAEIATPATRRRAR